MWKIWRVQIHVRFSGASIRRWSRSSAHRRIPSTHSMTDLSESHGALQLTVSGVGKMNNASLQPGNRWHRKALRKGPVPGEKDRKCRGEGSNATKRTRKKKKKMQSSTPCGGRLRCTKLGRSHHSAVCWLKGLRVLERTTRFHNKTQGGTVLWAQKGTILPSCTGKTENVSTCVCGNRAKVDNGLVHKKTRTVNV